MKRQSEGTSCFSGTDEAMFGKEMEISKNKLHIWNQQKTGNPMMVFLSRVSLFFINWQIFSLHFHYDNFQMSETFWFRNMRSEHGDLFPEEKTRIENYENYERILQTVPTFFEDTLEA